MIIADKDFFTVLLKSTGGRSRLLITLFVNYNKNIIFAINKHQKQ
jgi:hypothetical protein